MNRDDAIRTIAAADETERGDWATRLVELVALLGDDTVGFSGQASPWLFEDVKATRLYGDFTAAPDNPDSPDSMDSFDQLAAVCHEHGLVGPELRASLVELHDACSAYTLVGLHKQDHRERRLLGADLVGGDEHPLVTDARSALGCCVALLHRRGAVIVLGEGVR